MAAPPPPAHGNQIAFVQSALGSVGAIKQSITLDHDGVYELDYSVAGRSGPSGEGGNLPFTISLGALQLTSDASSTGEPFTAKSIQFTANAGTADLVIQGFMPVPDTNLFHDNTAFFDADTPANLIDLLLPNVLVKGEDYSNKEVVGRSTVENNGGKVILAPFLHGRSTTNTIHRIERV